MTESSREIRDEILRLKEKGLTGDEIARQLGFAHRRSIYYHLSGGIESRRSDRLTLTQRRFLGAIVQGKSDMEAAKIAGAETKQEARAMIQANNESKPFNDALERISEGTELSEEWLIQKVVELVEFEKPYTYYEGGKKKTAWLMDPSARKSGIEILENIRERLQRKEADGQQIIVQSSGLDAIIKHSGKSLDELLESGKIKMIEVVKEEAPTAKFPVKKDSESQLDPIPVTENV